MNPITRPAMPETVAPGVIPPPAPTKDELFYSHRRWARTIGRRLERTHREWQGRLFEGQAEAEAELALWRACENYSGQCAFKPYAGKCILLSLKTMGRSLDIEHSPLKFDGAEHVEDSEIEADEMAIDTPITPEPILGDAPLNAADDPEQFCRLVANCDPLIKRLVLDCEPRKSVARSLKISLRKLAQMEAEALTKLRTAYFRQHIEAHENPPDRRKSVP
jgi:hypothetical protein